MKTSALWTLLRHVAARAEGDPVIYLRLLRRAVRLLFVRHFSPSEVIIHGLLDPQLTDEELDFYPSREQQIEIIQRHVPPSYYSLTGDKSVFWAYCRGQGLPTPELAAIFDLPEGHTADGLRLTSRAEWVSFFRDSLPRDFFVKPAIGMLGRGAAGFRRQGAEFICHSGECLSAEALYDWLKAAALDLYQDPSLFDEYLGLTRSAHKLLIQKRLFAHPELVRLTGSNGLSCARIITFVNRDSDVRIIAATAKLISNGNLTDNFKYGGTGNIWSTVESATGRILRAHGPRDQQGSLRLIRHHPVTGLELNGIELPLWQEARALALRAARAFLPQPLIGWDIGITPDGPVLIEGNARWTTLPTPFEVPPAELTA